MAEIYSNPDPANPRPWFEYDVTDGPDGLSVAFEKANGLAAAGWTNASEAAEDALMNNSRHGLAVSPEKPDEVHVLAVTVDGDVVFVPRSEQAPVYYAHLGRYDPVDGYWDLLTFVEGTA